MKVTTSINSKKRDAYSLLFICLTSMFWYLVIWYRRGPIWVSLQKIFIVELEKSIKYHNWGSLEKCEIKLLWKWKSQINIITITY
jgi:hypothetical protein